MTERLRSNPSETFKKGDLVKLRDDLDAELIELVSRRLQQGTAYRILYVAHDEGGDFVWLATKDLHPQDIEDFRPELAVDALEERYRNAVFPISTAHLRKVLD